MKKESISLVFLVIESNFFVLENLLLNSNSNNDNKTLHYDNKT